MISNVTSVLIALTAAVCGIWVLRTAWQLKNRNWPLVLAGWVIIALSCVAWSQSTSADQGIAFGVIAFVVIALLFLLLSASQSKPRAKRSTRNSQNKNSDNKSITNKPAKLTGNQITQRTITALLIGPIAGIVALGASVASFAVLKAAGLEHSNNLTIAYLLFPLLWALLAVIIGFQQRQAQRTLTISSFGLIAVICIWLTT